MVNSRSEKEEMVQIAESRKAKKLIEEMLRKKDPEALTEKGIIKKYIINEKNLISISCDAERFSLFFRRWY